MVTERKADGLEDYPFRVEELTPARWWIIAYLDHPIIARAAFRAAVEQYPKARIRLLNRALVMRNTSRNEKGPRNDQIWREFVLKTPITGDLGISRAALGHWHAARTGKRETVMEIRSAKLFLAIGITFAVLALIVGVMMWLGQQPPAKLKAQQPAHEQSQQQAEQAHGTNIKVAEPASISLTDTKQAAVEHCRQVPGIQAWLGCMQREGVNPRELLKTGQ